MQQRILDRDVAIVTGGASGIGRAIAERFAKEGAIVVIADCDVVAGRETVDQIEGEITFVETDVREADDVGSLVQATEERFGSIDVLVNNAGGSFGDDRLHRVTEDAIDTNLAVNLKGQLLCDREVIPVMADSGGGSIVHMSSVNGLTGISLPSYSAAKSGVLALSRVVATQYGYHGIRSNVICPGTVDTTNRLTEMRSQEDSETQEKWLDQYPLQRFGEPNDVANAALYLASNLSSFVTGTELVVDGGLMAGLDHVHQDVVYDIEERPTSGSDRQ